jgi:hypothetical protein
MVLGRLAISALPGLGKAAGAIVGGKIPGGIFGQKAFEYIVALPLLGAAASALGLPFGYSRPQQPQAVGGGGGLTQQQFDYLYGKPNWQIGPFELPFGGQQGLLERQWKAERDLYRDVALGQQFTQRYGVDAQKEIARHGYNTQKEISLGQQYTQRYGVDAQKEIARHGYNTQKEISLGQQYTQRYGYDTQKEIARMNSEIQREIARNNREMGFASLQTGYATNDLLSRRQLRGLYGGYLRDVALADRNLAASYNRDRAQSRIESIRANLGKYQADRGLEAARINAIAPRLATISSIFTRRY